MTLKFNPTSKGVQMATDTKFSIKAKHTAGEIKKRIADLKQRPWTPQLQNEINQLSEELNRMELSTGNNPKQEKAPSIFDGLNFQKIIGKNFWD